MKNQNYLDLATSIDVLNTLQGGMTEPQVVVQQDGEGRTIRVQVPGIDKELIQVDINNNVLSVHYTIPLQSNDAWVRIPLMIYHKNLPYYIDIRKIHTLAEGKEVVIRLPFNKMAKGYHRTLKPGNV